MIEPYPDLFAEFAEAARHGVKRILTVHGMDDKEGITLGDAPPMRVETVPIFDMGFLRDLSTKRALDLDVYNALSKEGEEALQAGSFRLPFPECWFVIWFSDADGERYDTVNLLHAMETGDGGVHVVIYFRCFGAPGVMGKWTQAPIQTRSERDGFVSVTETRFSSEHWYAERKMDAEVALNNVLVSTLLIAKHPDPPESTPSDFLATVNRGRVRGKLAPLPAVRIIDLTRYNYPSNALAGGGGGTVRPHDRRAHRRLLKSGRDVFVRSSKIHGGSGTPPQYTVRW
jgi:hypothetical protein